MIFDTQKLALLPICIAVAAVMDICWLSMSTCTFLNTHDHFSREITVLKANGYTLQGGDSIKMILLPSEKGYTLKGKNLLPWGANSFLSE